MFCSFTKTRFMSLLYEVTRLRRSWTPEAIWHFFIVILETICENVQQSLRCYGNKRIHITTAFWGRADNEICKQLGNIGKCSSRTILQRVKTMCNGKHQCNIVAKKRHLGNPGCWFWVKLYFQTTYMCIERKNFLHKINIYIYIYIYIYMYVCM